MKKIIILMSVFFIILSCSSVYAMTQQEADRYNNLYYPQSVYNGGINSSEQNKAQEAYVEPSTGSAHIKTTDVTLPGINGFDLNITRTYNSQNSALFEAYLKETDTEISVTYYMIKGGRRVYKCFTDNSWTIMIFV